MNREVQTRFFTINRTSEILNRKYNIMTHRERYIKCLTGQEVDRPPYWLLWSPWATTRERWLREGMRDVENHRDLFDTDPRPAVVPVKYGPWPNLERVIEDDGEFIVHHDSWGVKRRDFKHGESMSEFLEFPVKNRADWEEFRDRYLDPDNPGRFPDGWIETCREFDREGVPVHIGYFPDVGLFGCLRWLLGDEDMLVGFYTMPDLIRDILEHLTNLWLTLFERVTAKAHVDILHMFEDLCGRQGSLISPAMWEDFFAPHYRRLRMFADCHDIPLFSVDTDGNPYQLIGPMTDAGANYMWPFEVAAGCDVNEVRRRFPGLAMMGGFDKRVLAVDREAIDRELERIRPVVEGGRYIPETDHSIPHDVSWDNYRYFADGLRKLVGKE